MSNYKRTFNQAMAVWTILATLGSLAYCRDQSNLDEAKCCLARGTQISLADGTLKTVEQLSDGDLILDAHGEPVEVFVHAMTDESENAVSIKTESGKSIIATQDHPFLDEYGHFTPASELRVGLRIQTVHGPERIVAMQKADKQIVYTVTVAKVNTIGRTRYVSSDEKRATRRADPFLGLSSEQHTFVANGFITGDALIQLTYNE